MRDQRGAIHLAESAQWLAWVTLGQVRIIGPALPYRHTRRKDEQQSSDVRYLAAQLAAAWDARLKQAA